jgi:Fe-S cluster biogenesis protein NfuA
MFIQTEATPNPATMKFLPGQDVLGTGKAMDFPTPESASASPLAERLFSLDQVAGVFLGGDFITVTKSDGEWQHIKPAILGAIMEHFTSGAPLLNNPDAAEPAASSDPDGEVVSMIKELLDTRVRPAVAQDGGDIVFSSFDEPTGTVYLQMRGACAGCPSATMTLQHGIENLLRHYVPEVNRVEPA